MGQVSVADGDDLIKVNPWGFVNQLVERASSYELDLAGCESELNAYIAQNRLGDDTELKFHLRQHLLRELLTVWK